MSRYPRPLHAFLYGKTHKPRTMLGSMVTPWRDEGFSEPTFNELADTVNTLCSAWSDFCRTAVAQGFSWQEALRHAMPDLFSSESARADGLREDSVFAYSVVKSDEEVMDCFLWRLEEGYC